VPDARHGGRGHTAGLHCLHKRSAAEPLTAKEEKIPTISPVHRHGERTISGEQDGRVNITHRKRECVLGSVMCFTETWLHDNVPDTGVNLAGFQLVRADRSCNESGKKKE